jgi:hypothetical protein
LPFTFFDRRSALACVDVRSAAHVRDIDIYTTRDKAAYSGGLFGAPITTWMRHVDGFAPADGHGGEPSGEHNYNLGLMLHYFLTGDPASSEAAIGLGRWVLDMDDGRQTVFRWLSRGARGRERREIEQLPRARAWPANSVLACRRSSSGDERFERKLEGLLRRIHPADDPWPCDG